MPVNIFSQHAEEAVLSILLKNPNLVVDVASSVNGNMFTSIPTSHLYNNIVSIYEGGHIPEYNMVIANLTSSGQLENCGGEKYIQYLMNQDYNADNFGEFCKIIINSYKAKELYSLASTIPSSIGKVDDVDSIIGDLKLRLDKLSEGSIDNVSNMEVATKSTWDELVKRISTGEKGITTGIKILDDVTGGFWPGDSWVVGGRPSMGKSALMCNMALTKTPTLIFSREMSRDSLIHRLIAVKGGVPVFNLRLANLTESQLTTVSNTIKEIKDYPIYIDTNFTSTPEYVVSTIRKYHKLYGVKVVHVDYIQLLVERDENMTNELGRLTRQMKLLANNLGIAVVLYSQLNRLVELRQDKRPILSDLRQSGNIEEDADIMVALYRDEVYNPETKYKGVIEFLIRKQRNGPTGVVTGLFEDVTNRIKDKE